MCHRLHGPAHWQSCLPSHQFLVTKKKNVFLLLLLAILTSDALTSIIGIMHPTTSYETFSFTLMLKMSHQQDGGCHVAQGFKTKLPSCHLKFSLPLICFIFGLIELYNGIVTFLIHF